MGWTWNRDAGQPRELLPVDESCRQLTQYLRDILQDPQQARLDIEQLDQACRELGEAMGALQALAQDLTLSIFNGNAGKAVNSIPKKGADPKEDRYSGIEIPYRFKGQEKRGVSFDFNYGASELDISFFECDLEYALWGGAAQRRYLDLNGAKLSVGQMRHWFFQAIFLS